MCGCITITLYKSQRYLGLVSHPSNNYRFVDLNTDKESVPITFEVYWDNYPYNDDSDYNGYYVKEVN